MPDRLGLGKQTNLFRARLLGWLYHHDWQLAGLLAVATIAAAAFVFWPRQDPAAATRAPAVISADDAEAAQGSTVIGYVSGALRNPRLYTPAACLPLTHPIVAA